MGEGQICQEKVQGVVSTGDGEDSIENSHTHTATGILSHCMSHYHLKRGHLSCGVVMFKTTDKPVTGEKLSLKVLTNEVVPEVCSKWYLLGIQLNLSDKVLDQIETDHPRDSDNMRCCIKMFSEWLSRDAGACWSMLMAALSSKAVAENELAAKLQGTTKCYMH